MVDTKKVKQIVKSLTITSPSPLLMPDEVVDSASWNTGFNAALNIILEEIKKLEKRRDD